MDSRIEESGRDFIENDLHYSFSMMEGKRIANLMLKCIEFGAKKQSEIILVELDNINNGVSLDIEILKLKLK